jgi:hypothetical protein
MGRAVSIVTQARCVSRLLPHAPPRTAVLGFVPRLHEGGGFGHGDRIGSAENRFHDTRARRGVVSSVRARQADAILESDPAYHFFYLAPTGTTNFGPNQCKNDKDGTVDPDERLRISGIAPGTYDAKLKDVSGRSCLVRNIKVEAGEIFSIEEKELIDCIR